MPTVAPALPFLAAAAPALASFDLAGLVSLYRGFEAAHDAFQGVYNMPRTKGLSSHRIESECERCTEAMQAVAAEAGSRQPTSRCERELRAEILVGWGVMTGSWPDIIAAARPLVGEDA